MPLTPHMLERLAKLEGLITDEVGQRLAELAASVPAERCIVEIGSYKGKSASYLASGALMGGRAPVFAIDPWDLDGNPGGRFSFNAQATRRRFLEQIAAAGVQHAVTPFRAFSRDLAKHWQRPIGLLYIDGSHTEADVRADVSAWSPWLSDGAILAFDDYRTERNPGVAKVVDNLRRTAGWRWEEGPYPLVVAFLP